MSATLAPSIVPLVIVIGAPLAGAVITLLIRLFNPGIEVKRTWVISSYVLMLIQAVGTYFAMS